MTIPNETPQNIELDFYKLNQVAGQDVIPVAVQDVDSGQLLTIAYVNAQALQESFDRGVAVFWSTTRNELWIKGETSGDALELLDIRINCENNSLLYLVRMKGLGACHTKDNNQQSRFGCFYRTLKSPQQAFFHKAPPYTGH